MALYQQLLFDDGLSRPGARGREVVFFALMPPRALAEKMAIIGRKLAHIHFLDAHVLPPERLHISLRSVGRFDAIPAYALKLARSAGAQVAAMVEPFTMTLDRTMSFSGHRAPGESRPVVLRETGDNLDLQNLQQLLAVALNEAGHRRARSSAFTPHATLLYCNADIPEYGVPPIIWTAIELVLIWSQVGRSRYVILDRWALGRKRPGHRS